MWKTPMYNTTKLTLELRDIVDNGENSVDIWDFDYPSYYKGEDKKAFEKKVIDHYYFRQIGQETVGRFIHFFQARMREIMPYYIRMYESVEIMDALENPFDNVDFVETFDEETSGQASGSTNGTQTETRQHRYSNTPQGSINNLDNFMTDASIDNDNTSSNGESSSESFGSTRHTFTKKGNQGVNTYAHDMMEFRQAIIDVDMMIINNLQDLFLGVY